MPDTATRHASPAPHGSPRISVLMPTFKGAPFIRRALESLRAQTLTVWELVVVDDGSPDETGGIVGAYRDDPRVRYHRLDYNHGLGATLAYATALARAPYLAYLPCDDLYYPDHLARLVALLDDRPDVYLAYAGLRWGYAHHGATLQGDAAVGREAAALAASMDGAGADAGADAGTDAGTTGGNLLALVQVAHRRDLEEHPAVRWTPRHERVSDRLEGDYWRALLDAGARFAHAGATTCEWVDHSDGRHRIIAGPTGGLARYRQHYGVGRGEFLDWQPTRGVRLDERVRHGRFAAARDLPAPGGLTILLTGTLGFNPERIVAFEERGHKLYGLWSPRPEGWDATGPFPYGNVDDIPYSPRDPSWVERVRQVRPDVIYGLLNWHALPLIGAVLDARLDSPLVFHFKEGPFICQEHGTWPDLTRILLGSDGQVFISEESRAWFGLALDGALDDTRTHLLDGDLPKADWFTDDWSPKLSARDGQIHTVCPGRPLGLDPFAEIARAGIHVHLYGEHFHRQFPTWTREGLATGPLHIHPAVEPADWVRELSRYDAAWTHLFDSRNGGDPRRASWDDLNLPARLGTYAAAGLPWIMRDNRQARVAVQELARRHDVGVFFRDFADLAERLRDRRRMDELTGNMRAARHLFAFDTHVDDLVAFFRRVIARRARRRGGDVVESTLGPAPGL